MKKFLVLLMSFAMIQCGSANHVAKRKLATSANNLKVIPNKEVVRVPSKEELDVIRGVIKETRKNADSSLNETTLSYIEYYAPLAMDEMRKFKIPASITLAQGILESGSGKSDLSNKSNNHFGIKCHVGWEGEKVYYDDDAKGECFRKYEYPATSYQDHSLFLTTRQRYAPLFQFEIDDYKAWAKGLKTSGYATDPKYADKLISYIEKYQLYRYDDMVINNKEIKHHRKHKQVEEAVVKESATATNGYIFKNPTPVVNLPLKANEYLVKEDDTLYSISKRFNISVDELKSLNQIEENNIKIGQILVVDKNKQSLIVANTNAHIVEEKDTLYSISKKYGLSVEQLKSLNGMVNNYISIGQSLKVK